MLQLAAKLLAPAMMLAFAGLPQTPAPMHHKTAAHASTKASVQAAEAKPKPGPKTADELQHELEAALQAAPLAGDQIRPTVAGKDITLRGEVHSAEHKGVATRLARKLADKAGWSDFHVLNQLEVSLGGH